MDFKDSLKRLYSNSFGKQVSVNIKIFENDEDKLRRTVLFYCRFFEGIFTVFGFINICILRSGLDAGSLL